MHVLVAADPPTDDDRRGDALRGELVVLAPPDVDGPAGQCAPDDAGVGQPQPDHFVGIDSRADVMRVEVVDLDVSPHVAMRLVTESLVRRERWTGDLLTNMAAQLTAEMLSIAGRFPVGTVLRMADAVLHAHVPLPDAAAGRSAVCDRGLGAPPR